MPNKYWHTGIDPKVQGTWNIHNSLKGHDKDLDFFLLTSSISGSVGTATEANYCAANYFLDNFARRFFNDNVNSQRYLTRSLQVIGDLWVCQLLRSVLV
jgi:hypothetical protein